MNRSGATRAIVRVRLAKELPLILFSCAAFALLAYVQRRDDAAARLAGCMLFGTLTAVLLALLQRSVGRFPEIELCEQAAPLYGRELARATALVPCIVLTAAIAAYWSVSALYVTPSLLAVAVSACGVYITTLIGLCGGVHTSMLRVAYVVLAAGTGAVTFLLATHVSAGLAIVFCIASGFAALRAYGEALARYDPV